MNHRVVRRVVRKLLPVFAVGLAVTLAGVAGDNQKPPKLLGGYTGVTVKAFTIDPNPATAACPKGLEVILQGQVIQAMQKSKLFAEVIDASGPTPFVLPAIDKGKVVDVPAAEKANPRRMVIDGTVVAFDKGSRAARYMVGFGAGEGKIKVRFVLHDAQTGQELQTVEVQATFKGMLSVFGGSANEAALGMAGAVAKHLTEEIRKNR